MAIIGKIRNYSWLLLVFVGIALLAFILGDFIRKGPKSSSTEIGNVAGTTIDYRDFEQRVEKQLEQYKEQNQKGTVEQATTYQIRQQVWSQMVREVIMNEQMEELGITVCSDELFDLVQGKEPSQYIVQNFTNPKTGQFNPADVVNFLNNLDKQEPKVRQQWMDLEKFIKEDRLNNKYNALISKGIYVTKAQAKRNNDMRNKLADCRFVVLKYNTISDSTVKVNDEEIKKYYEAHKAENEQPEATRDIEYVLFDVLPSSDDIKKVDTWINEIKSDFSKAEDPIAFAKQNADSKIEGKFLSKGKLSPAFDSVVFKKNSVGTVIGPLAENGFFKMGKVVDIQMRPDSIKARHILIAFEGAMRADSKVKRTKVQAKAKADSILTVIKKDTVKFGNLAKLLSDDPSNKDKGGDLGWFEDGVMIPSFNDACIKAKKGDFISVETDFGYHVIYVADKTKPVEKAKVAIIDRSVNPSDQTFQGVFGKANEFLSLCTNQETFEKAVSQKNMNKRIADNIKELDYSLPGMESARELVRWVYQNEKGKVSPVFDVGGKFVVAVIKNAKDKGIPTLDQIKNDMEVGAKRDKKAEMLSEKFNTALKSAKSLEDLSKTLNSKIDTVEGVSLSAFGIPTMGVEPEIIGTIFSMKSNVMSAPLKGKSGVAVIILDKTHDVPTKTDIKQVKEQLQGYMQSRVSYEAYPALEKMMNVVDNRAKFY